MKPSISKIQNVNNRQRNSKYRTKTSMVFPLLKDDNEYIHLKRYGWDGNCDKSMPVDIVGHSWFFKREDLATFWRELPDLNHSQLVGEDMHFSYTLQKYTNKKTYVPPHPMSDMEMWGSKPDTAWSIGTDSAAISRDWSNMNTMNMAFVNYINKGFKLLKNG
jgi:hypothetical protein